MAAAVLQHSALPSTAAGQAVRLPPAPQCQLPPPLQSPQKFDTASCRSCNSVLCRRLLLLPLLPPLLALWVLGVGLLGIVGAVGIHLCRRR